jgi:hypothetical protein
MRRLVVALIVGLVAGTGYVAAIAAGRSKPAAGRSKPASGPKCSVQNAGGVPSSAALGGWSYDVSFSCPFALTSFRVRTNKHLLSGLDTFGLMVPYAYARLSNGQQANFTCTDTATTSVTCTVSPALPARIVIVDGFDSSTVCRNTKKGKFQASLRVNGKTTRVSFTGKTTNNGSLTGGCG